MGSSPSAGSASTTSLAPSPTGILRYLASTCRSKLGLFLGAKRFGSRAQKDKVCIVFDRERFRFQRFISDIAGQDIHAHEGDWRILIKELSTWLRAQPGNVSPGGGTALVKEYEGFERALPAVCARRNIQPDELSFLDFNEIVVEYAAALRKAPARPN